MQLEVMSLNVTWRRDLWGHGVIVFWEMCQIVAEQLWQIWRRYAPPFFAICEKPKGTERNGTGTRAHGSMEGDRRAQNKRNIPLES